MEEGMQAELAANKNFHENEGYGLNSLNIQKVALAIFIKKLPFFILIFIFFFAVLEYIFWKQAVSRSNRYTASATLAYNPKGLAHYGPLDAKLATGLFVCNNVRKAVAAKLVLSPMEEIALTGRIEAYQVMGKANFIIVSTQGPTPEKAIELNRTIVALGIEEFLKFRTTDLTDRLDYLQKQKEAGLKELVEYELEMQRLLDPVSLATPEQQLTKLRQTISGQLMAMTELNIKVSNLQQKLDIINEQLKHIDPNIQEYLSTINYYTSEEARLNRELLRSRQLYTNQNPKVKAAQAELQLIQEEKEAFAKEKKIDILNPSVIQRLQQLKASQLSIAKELTELLQQQEITAPELEQNKKLSENLLSLVAEENKLNNKIASVRNTLRQLDADIPDLKILLASVPQELHILEPPGNAVLTTGQGLMKKTIIAIFLAGILTVNIAIAWVAVLYRTGKIESINEVVLLTGMDCLGGFPNIQKTPTDDDHLLKISHDLFFQLKDYFKDGQILFKAGFTGAGDLDKIRELLNVNFAMNGMRHFNLICDSIDNLQKDTAVEAPGCNCPDWEDELLAVEKINACLGHFCLNNPQVLLPSEIGILSRDINILKKHYDLIIISRKTAFNGNELSFRQLTDFAECTILLFGFRKTPRRILRKLARMKNSLSGQLCCLLTGVTKDDRA